MLIKINEIGIILHVHGVGISYRKYARKLSLEAIGLIFVLFQTGFSMCAVIHPSGKSIFEQFLFIVVSTFDLPSAT